MHFKNLTVLLTIFLLQCITSCMGGMGPGCDTDKYGVKYSALEITPFTSNGTIDTDKETAVDPADFGLNVSMLFEMVDLNVALNLETKAGFGFNPAMARDCLPAQYVFDDPVDHIEILITDINLATTKFSTDAFNIESSLNTSYYDGSQIEELYRDTELWHDDIIFTLTDLQAVPKTARFTIELHKESGAKLTAQTPAITFQDNP